MKVDNLIRMIRAVLDETRATIRSDIFSTPEQPGQNVNFVSEGLYDLYRFLENQANLTREMFQDQPRESQCSCYQCKHWFWLTMPPSQERNLGDGLPEVCIECWESNYGVRRREEGGTGISSFRDPKYRYRRETIEEAQKRRAKEDGEAQA